METTLKVDQRIALVNVVNDPQILTIRRDRTYPAMLELEYRQQIPIHLFAKWCFTPFTCIVNLKPDDPDWMIKGKIVGVFKVTKIKSYEKEHFKRKTSLHV